MSREAPRPVQIFSEEYLSRCRSMKPEAILEFLESFRLLHQRSAAPSRLISIKMPGDLLDQFKRRCALEEVPYQTQIKRLMRRWLRVVSAEEPTGP